MLYSGGMPIGAFVRSNFGIWNWVTDAFSVQMLESAPKPCTSSASESKFDHTNRILWSLHGPLCCCETDRTSFWSLDTQEVERGQLRCARNCTRNPRVSQLCLSVRVIVTEISCLHLTKITRIGLINGVGSGSMANPYTNINISIRKYMKMHITEWL